MFWKELCHTNNYNYNQYQSVLEKLSVNKMRCKMNVVDCELPRILHLKCPKVCKYCILRKIKRKNHMCNYTLKYFPKNFQYACIYADYEY